MTFPLLPPDPDGFSRALRAARQRRLRSMGLTTGAAGVTAVLVTVLLTNGGTSTLSQEDSVAHDPTPTSSTVAVASTDPARPNAAAGGPRPGASDPVGPTLAPTGGPAAGPRSSSVPLQGSAPVRGGYVAGPVTSKQNALDVPNCLGGPGTCGVAAYDGNGHQLDAYLCSSSTDPYTLHYPHAHEVDLAVLSGTRVVWRWSDFHRDGGPAHTGRLDSGRCTHWWVPYSAVDAQGRTLPKGDYVVRATFLAREVSEPVVDGAFTLD